MNHTIAFIGAALCALSLATRLYGMSFISRRQAAERGAARQPGA